VGTLRIIAGSFRGRRIRVPEGPSVRPTPDRVRESLFDILGPHLEGLDVLDLYAGSGALGLEALSRGARRAVFVESDLRTRKTLRENVRHLGVEHRARIVAGEALGRVGSGELGTFDLVFADPPYSDRSALDLPAILETAGTVRPGGSLVVEQDSRSPAPAAPEGWVLRREARYGRTVLRIYRVATGPPAERPDSHG
jgi:16S rRNA (guanine966-N2)-methyltransferase